MKTDDQEKEIKALFLSAKRVDIEKYSDLLTGYLKKLDAQTSTEGFFGRIKKLSFPFGLHWAALALAAGISGYFLLVTLNPDWMERANQPAGTQLQASSSSQSQGLLQNEDSDAPSKDSAPIKTSEPSPSQERGLKQNESSHADKGIQNKRGNALQAPANLTVTEIRRKNTRFIHLSWEKYTINESFAQYLSIEKAMGDRGTFKERIAVDPASTNYDLSIDPRITHWGEAIRFRLLAERKEEQALSHEAAITLKPANPLPPQNVRTKPYPSGVILEWDPPSVFQYGDQIVVEVSSGKNALFRKLTQVSAAKSGMFPVRIDPASFVQTAIRLKTTNLELASSPVNLRVDPPPAKEKPKKEIPTPPRGLVVVPLENGQYELQWNPITGPVDFYLIESAPGTDPASFREFGTVRGDQRKAIIFPSVNISPSEDQILLRLRSVYEDGVSEPSETITWNLPESDSATTGPPASSSSSSASSQASTSSAANVPASCPDPTTWTLAEKAAWNEAISIAKLVASGIQFYHWKASTGLCPVIQNPESGEDCQDFNCPASVYPPDRGFDLSYDGHVYPDQCKKLEHYRKYCLGPAGLFGNLAACQTFEYSTNTGLDIKCINQDSWECVVLIRKHEASLCGVRINIYNRKTVYCTNLSVRTTCWPYP